MDFTPFFTLSHYIETTPTGDFFFGFICLFFFGTLLLLPSALKAQSAGNKYLKKSVKKGLWKFTVLGVVGMILTLSRFGEVPVISMRLWLYLVFVIALVFLIRRGVQMFFDYRKRLASVKRELKK